MQIVFGLPNGAGGQAASFSGYRIRQRIREFEQQTNCELTVDRDYRNHRHWLKVTVPDSHWMLFQIYWEPDWAFIGWIEYDKWAEGDE